MRNSFSQTQRSILRSAFVWFGFIQSVSESGQSAARACAVPAEMSAAWMHSAPALLLAGVHGFPLLRRNQSVHLLSFLLMNSTDALLFLRGRK